MSDEYQSIPFNDIIKIGEKRMLDRPLFTISWVLGRFCNYKCSYCWPHARSDEIDYQNFEVYTNAIDEIKRQARENGFAEFHWSFSGGEPTAYKNLLDLIKYLDDNMSPFQGIHMTTNLSPGKKWWDKWCENTSMLQQRNITASYHDEYAIESVFKEKCLQLIDSGVGVTVNQVMVPNLFWKLYDRCMRFYQSGINVTLKPQSDTKAISIIDGYTEKMLDIMQTQFPRGEEFYRMELFDHKNKKYTFDQSERFNAYGFNMFENWDCASGFQSIIIKGNQVKRAHSCHDIPIGSLTNFKLFKSPKQCITRSCICSADSKIPKWKCGY
jgi:organic radical activating enzyme